MIYPSIAELTQDGKINRYTLVVATAKCARIITDEYVKQREYAEKLALNKESDKNKNIANLVRKEYRDEKAVKNAINGLHSGEFRILSPEEAEEMRKRRAEDEERKKAEEAAMAQAVPAEDPDEDYDDEDLDLDEELEEDADSMLENLMNAMLAADGEDIADDE